MRRLATTLVLVLGLASLPGLARSEVEEAPAGVVTLDALPLGIPLGDLPDAARARTETVLGQSLFAQRVTAIRYRSREAVFRFLLDHPDFAATVARALRLGGYRLSPVEDGYWGDDGRGAKGLIRVLYQDDQRRLYHLEGRYEPRGLPTVTGQLLVLLEFHHEEDALGNTIIDSSVTGHLRLDTPVVGALAEMVGALARPLVERAVERKVRRFFTTVSRVSRWAYDEPEQLVTALDGHPDVPQDATLDAFREILLAGRPPLWARLPYRLFPEETPRP